MVSCANVALSLCFLAAFVSAALTQRDAYEGLTEYQEEYELPALPYDYDGLEPYIDEATLHVHHLGHHQAYADKMNAALKEWRETQPSNELAFSSIIEILQRIDEVPSEWRTTLRNNGGGFVNHIFYWSTMCPYSEAQTKEGQEVTTLYEDIKRDFGSYEAFEEDFTAAASTLFGSGYAWLVQDSDGVLDIINLPNQDSPLSIGLYPLLVLDVWEHAYYLKHQNLRPDYIADWWEVTCWRYVQDIRDFWTEGSGAEFYSIMSTPNQNSWFTCAKSLYSCLSTV